MPTLDDVAGLALALPETAEGTTWGNRAWKVKGKLFVWERPLTKKDREHLGDATPEGPLLGAKVEHEIAKHALLQDPSGVFLTTPHFDGYAIVLAQLDLITADVLREVVTEAWLVSAPPKVAALLDA